MSKLILHPSLPSFEELVGLPDHIVFTVGVGGPLCAPHDERPLGYFGEFADEGYERQRVRARHLLIDPLSRMTITTDLVFGPFKHAVGIPTHAFVFIGGDGQYVHVIAELIPDPATNPNLQSCLVRANKRVTLHAGTLYWSLPNA